MYISMFNFTDSPAQRNVPLRGHMSWESVTAGRAPVLESAPV